MKGNGHSAKRPSAGRTKTLERAITLLDGLAHEGTSGLSDLARKAGLPKTTTYRLLSTLSRQELTTFDPAQGTYRLGPRVFIWAEAMRSGRLGTRNRAVLEQLRDATNETVGLVERFGFSRVCVIAVPSPHELQATVRVGHPKPVHVGAPGKVLLSYLPESEVRAIAKTAGLPPATRNSVTNVDILLDQLRRIRRQGYGTSVGESIVGMYALAVPVLNSQTKVVAALSLFAPQARVRPERERAWIRLFKSAAADLSRELGYRGSSLTASGG